LFTFTIYSIEYLTNLRISVVRYRDSSILIVDTYSTIPVSPCHDIPQYIVAVQNTVKWHKYRAQRRYRASRITWD